MGAKNNIPNRNLSKNTITIITIITSAIYTKEFRTILYQNIKGKKSYNYCKSIYTNYICILFPANAMADF